MAYFSEFKCLFEQFYLQHNNIGLSGYAIIGLDNGVILYSASVYVKGDGPFLVPSLSEMTNIRAMLSCQIGEFSLHDVRYVEAYHNNEKLLRWQVQYVHATSM